MNNFATRFKAIKLLTMRKPITIAPSDFTFGAFVMLNYNQTQPVNAWKPSFSEEPDARLMH